MFGLTGATKYKYIPNYRDMRGGYDKLSGVVRTLGENPEDGTAYVFMSRIRNLSRLSTMRMVCCNTTARSSRAVLVLSV